MRVLLSVKNIVHKVKDAVVNEIVYVAELLVPDSIGVSLCFEVAYSDRTIQHININVLCMICAY